MQVRMNKAFVFPAGGAFSAAIINPLIKAIDKLRISNGQRQGSAPFRREEQLRMAHPIICYSLYQLLLYRVLSCDVSKLHLVQNTKFLNFITFAQTVCNNIALQPMPRILAFDYGTKRIGIAVTDPLQIIATGLDTIHPKDILDWLKTYLQQEQVEAFVLGDPKQMDGTPSDSAQHVKGFSTLLRKNFPHIPQHRVDERFTSKIAHQTILQSGLKKQDRQNKERVDTISATIILQYFMEQHRL